MIRRNYSSTLHTPVLVCIPDPGLCLVGHVTAPWRSLIYWGHWLSWDKSDFSNMLEKSPRALWYQIWNMVAYLHWESLLKLSQLCAWTNQTLLALKYSLKPEEIREVPEVQGCSEVFWWKEKGKNYLRQKTGDHISAISQSTFRIIYAFVDSTKKVFITLNKTIEWTIPARCCEMNLFFHQALPRSSNMSKTSSNRVNRDVKISPPSWGALKLREV